MSWMDYSCHSLRSPLRRCLHTRFLSHYKYRSLGAMVSARCLVRLSCLVFSVLRVFLALPAHSVSHQQFPHRRPDLRKWPAFLLDRWEVGSLKIKLTQKILRIIRIKCNSFHSASIPLSRKRITNKWEQCPVRKWHTRLESGAMNVISHNILLLLFSLSSILHTIRERNRNGGRKVGKKTQIDWGSVYKLVHLYCDLRK